MLYTSAADAKTQMGVNANLSESCFWGWIIHVWGYLWHLGA